MNSGRAFRAILIALGVWLLAFIFSLKFGSVPNADIELITQLRLPRVILATAVGIGLSVAGAALQALLANPLCEPYTLGISSGAALGAVIGISLGVPGMFAGLAVSAFVGALLFTVILFLVSRRSGTSTLTLLLTGVMMGFLGSSLVALWMALGDPNGVQGAMVWLLGDLSRARLSGSLFTLAGVLSLAVLVWMRWADLDRLLMGEEDALSMGVAVTRVRTQLILLAALLIAICVSAAGMIGFVGLVIPHFARRWVGSLHVRLIPVAAIWGAVSLTAADGAARFIAAPLELPIGVVTALVGAPVFLWVVLRNQGGRT